MDKTIQKKMDALAEKQEEADRLVALREEFPDLRIVTDRWQRERYVSKTVNARATEVDFRHNCGCCPDSPLEARPYIETMGTTVFADPDKYWVAQQCDYSDMADPGWKDAFYANNISQQAIDKVESHLRAVAPEDYPYAYEESRPKPKPARARVALTNRRPGIKATLGGD
jgi:hypothetical protein